MRHCTFYFVLSFTGVERNEQGLNGESGNVAMDHSEALAPPIALDDLENTGANSKRRVDNQFSEFIALFWNFQ